MTDDPVPLRFRDAAFALDMQNNPTPLRNWLRRHQFEPEGGYGEKWAEFSFRDLAALAIIQKLIPLDVSVEDAAALAEFALNKRWRAEFESNPKAATAPTSGFVADEEAPPPLPPRLYVYSNRKGKRQIDWGPEGYKPDSDVWITVDAHRVIAAVITRALESAGRAEPSKRRRAS